jgi:hypothetical protein
MTCLMDLTVLTHVKIKFHMYKFHLYAKFNLTVVVQFIETYL